MKSVFMLAVSNLRKHKGAMVSLGIMILIAALLMNLGLIYLAGLPRVFDNKMAALDTPYVSTAISNDIGTERQAQIDKFITDYSGVTKTQTERVLYFPSASFSLKKGGSYSNAIIVENENESKSMGKLTFIGVKGPQTDKSIYVPYILKAKGYRLGDNITIIYCGKSYIFKITGFTEDLLLGSLQTGGIRFFMPDIAYRHFTDELKNPGTQSVMISARSKSIGDASNLYDAIGEKTSGNAKGDMLIGTFGIDIIKLAVSMPVNMGSAMEIAFAFVVAIVVLLVVRFRIVNSIEEDMRNIGALEAVGYTSRQIRSAFILQFLTISFIGSILGIALSYAAAVKNSKLLVAETGLSYAQKFDLPVSLLVLFIMFICVLFVAFIATRRIRKLPVVVALRGGITTHSFRKNHIPLEHSHGPLNFLLSLKSMLAGIKKNIALVIILAAISFASIFTFMLFYNFGVNKTAVMHTMGGEPDDILIGVKTSDDAKTLQKGISTLNNVTQVIDYGYTTLKADGKIGYGRITSDYSKLKNNQTYKGRYPKHDNEAAIGGKLSDKLHKYIGDSISISYGGVERKYIITGLTQSISDIGKGIYITTSGIRRLLPSYIPLTLYVYTKNNSGISETIHNINTNFSKHIITVSNDYEAIQSVIGSYEQVVALFSAVIFAVMGLIVILILTLITEAMLVRRRQEFGIEKALGFTTWQLIRQVSFSFLPIAIIGSLTGSILGYYCADPLMACMFRTMGIMRTNFIVPAETVPVVCIIISLLTYLISMIAAGKARRISPCALVNE